jgi:hypothetical protein
MRIVLKCVVMMVMTLAALTSGTSAWRPPVCCQMNPLCCATSKANAKNHIGGVNASKP